MLKLIIKDLDFFFFEKFNKFAFFSRPLGKLAFIFLPKFFFFKNILKKKLKFYFMNNFNYLSFFSHLVVKLNSLKVIYFLKLRLRGLGYRFRRYTPYFFRFYFTRTNFIYFHVPFNLIVKKKKKRILLISMNYHLLRLVFVNLMYLYKIGPYIRKGLVYPRQIFFLKPIKKLV